MDNALQEAQERKTLLYNRRREALVAAKEARDPAERKQQEGRARILWEMYQEACAEVRRLDPSPQKRTPGRRKPRGSGRELDVLMQSGTLWADLEGHTWSQLAGYTWGGVSASDKM